MSVNRAQLEITSAEFAEWMAYYNVEPFGEERADLRQAITTSVLANAHRGKGKAPYKTTDFMPKFKGKVKQTVKEMSAIFKNFAQAHNAGIKK